MKIMKHLFNLTLFASVLPLFTSALDIELSENFYKKFKGVIITSTKQLDITMDLNFFEDSLCEGTYYYHRIGAPIKISGTIDKQGNLTLTEYAGTEETGIFTGQFINEREIKGFWMKPYSTAKLTFELKEYYSPGSAQFEMVKLHDKIGDREKGNCFKMTIVYPVMTNYKDFSIEGKINNAIDTDRETHKNFIKEEIEAYKPDLEFYESDGYATFWYEYYDTKVVFNSDYIVSYEQYIDTYTGGAHGSHLYNLVSFDLHTGDTISLQDILIPNKEKAFCDVAEEIFRKNQDIDPDASLAELGYWGFDSGEFWVNNNFLLTEKGIRFIYNEYEIAPYAAGAIELFIPYEKIEHMVNPESPIDVYLR